MWKIFAVLVMSSSFLAQHPEIKTTESDFGTYNYKQFQSEEECNNFLKAPDEQFAGAQKQLIGAAKDGITVRFDCRQPAAKVD